MNLPVTCKDDFYFYLSFMVKNYIETFGTKSYRVQTECWKLKISSF